MKKFRNILWGLAFVAVGVIFGLNALGITDITLFFDGWWTLFIIVPCFIGLFSDHDKVGNIIGITIGGILLLCCQDILSFDKIWKLIIPIILVTIGLSLLFKNTISNKVNAKIKELNHSITHDKEYCAVFGNQNLNFNNEIFDGAELTAVFGGVKCDLSNAIITADTVINASAIFGGIDIIVPQSINVKIKSTPVFGGVKNSVNNAISENLPTLYIDCVSVFGGVEIK